MFFHHVLKYAPLDRRVMRSASWRNQRQVHSTAQRLSRERVLHLKILDSKQRELYFPKLIEAGV
jgi:hypothetical protein